MGLISLTWVFCHNLVKFHLAVIEIAMTLFLKTADGDHPAEPNCKKSKWVKCNDCCNTKLVQFHLKIFPVSYFASLVRNAILTGLFLFNFDTTQCKNHFYTNLVKLC